MHHKLAFLRNPRFPSPEKRSSLPAMTAAAAQSFPNSVGSHASSRHASPTKVCLSASLLNGKLARSLGSSQCIVMSAVCIAPELFVCTGVASQIACTGLWTVSCTLDLVYLYVRVHVAMQTYACIDIVYTCMQRCVYIRMHNIAVMYYWGCIQ